MVWTAVVLGLLWAVLFAWTVRREFYWRGICEVKEAKIGVLERSWQTATIYAEKAEQRYFDLLEKLREKAGKPASDIIHAKNSGDVRRIFEQQVSAQQIEADKRLEN